MNEIRNKIITISGEPVSGKSTAVRILEEKYKKMGYNVHVIKTGHVFRELIMKEYLKMYPDRIDANLADVQNDETFAPKRDEIDKIVDEEIARKGQEINSKERPNDVYIIDSRLAWHNIPNSYAVRLTVNEKIAGQRSFTDKTRGAEDRYKTVQDAIQKTKERKIGEIERYKKRYGVDLADPENYDLIIDTSYSNPKELVSIIINGEKNYRQGEFYPQTWASPVNFIPLQIGRYCSNEGINKLIKNIREEGYKPYEGLLNIYQYKNTKILIDGNHRARAAMANGKTLLPYMITHTDDKMAQYAMDEIDNQRSPLESVWDWADAINYYGGKIGNIEQFKNTQVTDLFGIEQIPLARKYFNFDSQGEEGR